MQIKRIAIIEDDDDWLQAIKSFLKAYEDIHVEATGSSRTDVLEILNSKDIDIIIMDIKLNNNFYDGIYAVLEILQIKKVKVIMLSSLKDEQVIKDAFTAGAIEYIVKDNFYDLPFIIRRVHDRIAPSEILVKEFQRLKREEQLKELTASEKELFQYLESGYKLNQIATIMFKAQNTLKQQVRSILKKLNVRSSKAAVKKVKYGGLYEEKNPPN